MLYLLISKEKLARMVKIFWINLYVGLSRKLE